MRRSTERFLTTHVGSLPHLVPLDRTAPAYETRLHEAVEAVLQKQRALGIDIVNEGEYTKGGDWLGYLDDRFGGFEQRPPKDGMPIQWRGKDREEFAEFYKYANERGTLFFMPGGLIHGSNRPHWVCTGPVTYTGGAALAREIAVTKSALAPNEEAFLTTTAPASLEPYRENEYYKTQEGFVFAVADALAVEYRAIADAGLLLQVDDAWLPALWDRIGIQMGMDAFKRRCEMRIEALNHALSGIQEDRIRYHLCWGSWHGPHAFDIEMRDFVELMLKVRAGAYSFEAANARHEHEYTVWDDVKLPGDKIIIPGVITHATDVIEHPELVAQRIWRFADRVGRERVIAGADCGFGGRSHPQIAWAKLKALCDGAALASAGRRG